MLSKKTTVLLVFCAVLAAAVAPAEAGGKRARKPRAAAAATTRPLVFRSTGTAGTNRRDRTVTFQRTGEQVRVTIQDHVANRTITGTVDVGPERDLTTGDPELANAVNILAITPAVLADLRAESGNVVITEGIAEANGKVYPVEIEHELKTNHADGGATVLTRTSSKDGKLKLETVSRVDRNGIPLSATIRGRLKVFLFTADINLSLKRVSGSGF